jgi:hypothetical protein
MYSLLLAAALMASAENKAPSVPGGDGRWLIVYAEEGGRRNNAWEQQQAMFKGTTLTFTQEGKTQSLTLTFGKHQTVKAVMSGDKEEKGETSYSGVYIAGQDYFCLSLEGTGKDGKKEETKKEGEEKAEPAKVTSSGSFIMILRRQRK